MQKLLHRVCAAILTGIVCSGASCTHSSTSTPSAFYLPSDEQTYSASISSIDASKTSPSDLFKLVDALDAAYQAAALSPPHPSIHSLSPPHPSIHIVEPNHDRLQNNAVAVAMDDSSGRDYIYFNRDGVRRALSLNPIVFHEVAHLKAWRLYGHDIEAHGPEFKTVCWALTSRYHCTEAEPLALVRRRSR